MGLGWRPTTTVQNLGVMKKINVAQEGILNWIMSFGHCEIVQEAHSGGLKAHQTSMASWSARPLTNWYIIVFSLKEMSCSHSGQETVRSHKVAWPLSLAEKAEMVSSLCWPILCSSIMFTRLLRFLTLPEPEYWILCMDRRGGGLKRPTLSKNGIVANHLTPWQ